LYGADKEAAPLLLDHNQVLRRLENEAFYSHILTININGTAQEAVLRDVQRHPAKPHIMHMDFQRISQDRAIRVHVPLHFINEDKCEGVKTGGGLISKVLSEVEVECLPRYLPEFIEVDMAKVQLGESLHLSQLQLSEGVKLVALAHGDSTVAMVYKPRAVEEEAPVAATPAEGEAAAAAAPAAGAEGADKGGKGKAE
ncbi:MAG TPA: 50S ribosomal protein L25/general stress protein Ctc, partial [Gammaproteobacteria bacterium]|nr:50S ribosomal protein L25/general stress protein Ctc [Gammaproteobacteria bacterium]